MKNLVFATLMLGGLLPATGCIFSSDSGGTSGVEFDLTFTCPPDADGITVTTTPSGGGTAFNDDFNCADGVGVVKVDPGDYDMFATPTGAAGTFASSASVSFPGTADGDLINVDFSAFPTDMGFIGLSWTVDGTTTCPSIVGGVSVDATLVGPNNLINNTFTCTDGSDLTDPMGFGHYSVVVSLLDTNDLALSTTSPVEFDMSLGDQLEDLGNVDLSSTGP